MSTEAVTRNEWTPEPLKRTDHSAKLRAARAEERRRRRRASVAKSIAQVAIVVALVSLWQYLSSRRIINPAFFGRPSSSFTIFVDHFSLFMRNALVTLEGMVIGLVISVAAGVIVGWLLASLPRVNRVVDPFITVLNTLPRIALIPLFILWFGIGTVTPVASVVTLCFFIVLINTRAGVESIDTELTTVAVLLGANSLQRFTKVQLPAALPAIFAAIRLSVTYSMLGIITGEMLASGSGLGDQVQVYSGNIDAPGLFTTLGVIVVMALAIQAIVRLAERRLLRWRDEII